jgi:hypothetical protein
MATEFVVAVLIELDARLPGDDRPAKPWSIWYDDD